MMKTVMAMIAVSLSLEPAVGAEPKPEGEGLFGAYAASKEWTLPEDPAVLKRLERWQDRKVGVLIHWGTYSQWGITESWSLVTTRHPWNPRPAPFANLSDADYKKVKDYTWRQVEEIVSRYGPQEVLWLDGGSVRPPHADIDMDGLAAMARKHQPGLIVVDRTVHGRNENYVTPEGTIPDHYLPYPWETCMTMGTKWVWTPNDHFKSAGTLIRNLCRIVARNGNYLIGIGPDGKGQFDPTVYDRLQEIGQWLEVNGKAIYATRPVKPYEQDNLVFTGTRDGTVYAIVLSEDDASVMPAEVRLPKQLLKDSTEVELLGYGDLQADADGRIAIPQSVREKPPCQHAWALRLR